MVQLQSEPLAIPDPPSIKTTLSTDEGSNARQHRKHLEWMFPLVVKAIQVSGKERDDGQVLQALGKVLHEIGQFE